MSTIIIYESAHHGNTLKLVNAITEAYGDVTAVSIEKAGGMDLRQYDRIGIAAGIAFGKFYEATEKFAEESVLVGSSVFLLYTYGSASERYTKSIRSALEGKDCRILGSYGCLGYDTFGPFKLVGGLAKGHPTEDEIAGAVRFYGELEA